MTSSTNGDYKGQHRSVGLRALRGRSPAIVRSDRTGTGAPIRDPPRKSHSPLYALARALCTLIAITVGPFRWPDPPQKESGIFPDGPAPQAGCAARPMPNRRRRVSALATACWVSDHGLIRRNASPTVTGSNGVLNEVYPSKRRDAGLAAIWMLRSATRDWNRSPARRQNPGAKRAAILPVSVTILRASTPNGRECLNADQIAQTALAGV